MKVGIVGASGYGGAELLRLCAGHPDLEVAVAQAGIDRRPGGGRPHPVAGRRLPGPRLRPDRRRRPRRAGRGLPGPAPRPVPAPGARPGRPGRASWSTWPPTSASRPGRCTRPGTARSTWRPSCSDTFVYGLPELHRDELVGATRIAAPGCYPTAALLALAPFVEAGVVALGPPTGAPPLVVDAASGTSGAGRAPKDSLHFAAVDEDFVAYGLLDHRHTAEMEQGLGTPVLFTPHLAPMVRGILATCYARPADPGTADHGGRHAAPARPLRRRAVRRRRPTRRRRPRRPAAPTPPT